MPNRSPRQCALCRRIIPAGPCPHCSPPWRSAKRPKGSTRRSRKLRAQLLAEQPMCAGYPAGTKCDQLATEDDHIVPWSQRGRMSFVEWDRRENHQGLCVDCHMAKTLDESRAGRSAVRGSKRR